MYKLGKRDKDLLFFGIVGLVFIITRVYNLTSVPQGFNTDELAMAYNVKSLLAYGIDRYGESYPLYFNNVDSGQSCLSVYLTVLLCRIFGYSDFTFRLVAVILGAVLLIFVTLTAKEIADITTAKIAAALVTILPFFIMSERWQLDCYAMAPMLAVTIYCAVKLLKLANYRWAILLGLSAGISLYSYALATIVMFIFLLIVLITFLIAHKDIFKPIVTGIIALISGSGVVYYVGVITLGFPEIRTKFFSITCVSDKRVAELGLHVSSLQQFIDRVLVIFDCDLYKNVAMEKFGTLYSTIFAIALVIAGLTILVAKLRKNYYVIPVLAAVVANLMLVVLLDETVIYRHNAIFVCIVILMSLPIGYLIRRGCVNKALQTAGIIILAYYVLSFTGFYPRYLACDDNVKYFDSGLTNVIRQLNEEEKVVYVDDTADYAAYLCILYGKNLDCKEFLATVKNYDKYNMSFLNYHLSIPEDAIGTDAVFVIRDYEKYDFVYALRGNDYNEAFARLNSYMDYAISLEAAGYKKETIGNFNVYRR